MYHGKIIRFYRPWKSEETSGVPRAHNWKVVQKDKGKYIREKEGGELTKTDTIVNRDLIRGS